MVTESVVTFLRNVPPFQFLPPGELQAVARAMTLEYFPKETVIIRAGERAPEMLYVIQKGGVKLALRTQVGKQIVFDMRSEGELFGVMSLLGREAARLDVTSVEDTLCYAIPAEEMEELGTRYPEVSQYLLRTSLFRYIDRSLDELRAQTNLMGSSERLLYSVSVRELSKSHAVTCRAEMTIGEAARLASRTGVSCVCVVDEGGKLRGIVTDRDFTTKVVGAGRSPEAQVSEIMSAPVVTVKPEERLFEVLLAMLNHDIHHVVVAEDEVPQGVLTSHDLMLLQGKSPLNIARHIEQQRTVEGLREAQQRSASLLPLLLREGAKASHVTRVMAHLNDRVVVRILELAQEKLGAAPAPFCWVVLGSEGRCEQTFKTDQDNALIYDDAGATKEGEEYFAALAEFVRDALVECGYPLCPGEFMAANPRWRGSVSAWKEYFRGWIAASDKRSAEDALLFFDMRPVAGDFRLCDTVAEGTRELLKTASTFKSVVARISINHKPPIGFFRSLVVERTGEHKNELDLKWYGIVPIVNAARLYALEQGVRATNTWERLGALQPDGQLTQLLITDLREAFEFLTLLRIEIQLRQIRDGRPAANYVSPSSLNHLQRSLLKEAFHAIARAQSAIVDRFESAVWPQLER